MFRTILRATNKVLAQPIALSTRTYVAAPKRFYQNVDVLSCDGKYEIVLDNKKLKTPSGAVFSVASEPLAMAISAEWEGQKETINRSRMHLTQLANTAQDNPNNLTKFDVVNYMLNYISTDTILYHSQETEELYKMQCAEWDPIIEWFNERYDTDIEKSCHISQPVISAKTKMNISKHLHSYNDISMHGFIYAVDTIKSVILTMACVDRFVTLEQAVWLSRLEEEFQLKFWERVEWAHDSSKYDTQSRLAASILFIHFNTSEHKIREKMSIH